MKKQLWKKQESSIWEQKEAEAEQIPEEQEEVEGPEIEEEPQEAEAPQNEEEQVQLGVKEEAVASMVTVGDEIIEAGANLDCQDSVREFVKERLTAAAAEIFIKFHPTLVQYQEEMATQHRLLDMILKPQIQLHRIGRTVHSIHHLFITLRAISVNEGSDLLSHIDSLLTCVFLSGDL